MSKKEFLDKVEEIVYRDNCTIMRAIEKAQEESSISDEQLLKFRAQRDTD